MKIKAVLFDIGGTIFYSDTVEKDKHLNAANALIKYLKQHNIKVNCSNIKLAELFHTRKKEYKKWSTKHNNIELSPYDVLTKFALKDLVDKKCYPTIKIIANQITNLWKTFGLSTIRPHAKEVLAKLAKMKIKLGIISNTDSYDYVIRRLCQNNIYQYFDPTCIYLSVQSQIRKPDKSIFIAACNDLCVKPNETVYVGDTISRDVIGSNNAKLKACIRFDKGKLKEQELQKYDTKYLIKDFNDLIPILNKIK